MQIAWTVSSRTRSSRHDANYSWFFFLVLLASWYFFLCLLTYSWLFLALLLPTSSGSLVCILTCTACKRKRELTFHWFWVHIVVVVLISDCFLCISKLPCSLTQFLSEGHDLLSRWHGFSPVDTIFLPWWTRFFDTMFDTIFVTIFWHSFSLIFVEFFQ